MCFCLRCTPAGPTTAICGCDIEQSKTLYFTLPSGGAKPAWMSPGTYTLTYAASPGPSDGPCPAFGIPYGEGWFYEDSSMILAFTPTCGIASCSKGFGSTVGAPGTSVSCDPLLVNISGALLSGTVHE